jgi:HEAT repeat protein
MKNTIKRLPSVSLSAAVLTASFAAFAAGSPGENPTQSKYVSRSGVQGEMCARDAALESTYVTSPAAAAKIDTALRATASRSDWPRASAVALSALAQRGDKPSVAALTKLLASPKEEVREIAVSAFGAQYDTPEAFLNYVGRKGVVPDPAAVSALTAYIENEPKEERRANALRALGAIRSFLQ